MKVISWEMCEICKKRNVPNVCIFEEGDSMIPSGVVDQINGKIVYFCSIKCHEEFKKSKEV